MYSLSRTAFVRARLRVFLFTFVLFTKQVNVHFEMTFFWLTGSINRAYIFQCFFKKIVYVYHFFFNYDNIQDVKSNGILVICTIHWQISFSRCIQVFNHAREICLLGLTNWALMFFSLVYSFRFDKSLFYVKKNDNGLQCTGVIRDQDVLT